MIDQPATIGPTAALDHAAAREVFATALDFPLQPEDQAALDAHLHACAACRSFAAGARRDAATLRELDFGPVPIAVRANIAIAAENGRRGGALGRWVALAATAAILLLGLGGGALLVGGGGGGGRSTTGLGGGNGVYWETNVVQFKAEDFWLDANGQRFLGSPKMDVNSDPGDATNRTLELTWQEHGVEMRMNLYFSGDATTAWINEIRVYDGTAKPDWKTVTGRFAPVPLGATWTGDLDVDFQGTAGVAGGPAHLHAGGAAIRSIPFDGITEPVGPAIKLGERDRPFSFGGPLHCSGILQMPPPDAERILLKLGYKVSWRLNTTTGPNTGFAQPLANAPDGIIFEEPVPGSNGELIVFVAPNGDPMAKALPLPADCPNADPNASPPQPKR
jgi:hypothetical protein